MLSSAWGGAWPATLLRSASSPDRHALRLGPDEWLLIADRASAAAGLALQSALSLVDVSSRNIWLEITGRRSATALNGGCPLDLREAAFPPLTATRTVFGKAEIVLWRPGPASAYRIACLRSFGPYIHALLSQAVLDL